MGIVGNAALAPKRAAIVLNQPELPHAYVDTSMPWQLVDNPQDGARTPRGGVYRVLPPAANPDQEGQQLYNALNQAKPFDEIVTQPRRVYRHHLIPPEKPGNGWIIVRPAVVSTLPAADFRFDPQAHGEHVSILTVGNFVLPGGSILLTGSRAHHYRFIGLKFECRQPGTNAIVQLGDGDQRYAELPHHVVFDRCWFEGIHETRRALALRGHDLAVINSHIANISSLDAESHGITLLNGGRHKFVNNYAEAATENFFAVQQGGFGWLDYPREADIFDLEIRRNYFAKPLKWNPADPSYDGVRRLCKNLFEIKNGSRVLIEENEFHHAIGTAGPAAQPGYMFVLSVRNDDGQAPRGTIHDVWLRWNRFKGGGSGTGLDGIDGGMLPAGGRQGQRWRLEQNLWEDIARTYWARDVFAYKYRVLIQPGTPVRDLQFIHNTFIHGDLDQIPVGSRMACWWNSNGNDSVGFTESGFAYVDNIADSAGVGAWISGSGHGRGLAALVRGRNYSSFMVNTNLWFGERRGQAAIDGLFPAPAVNAYGEADIKGVGFVNPARQGGDYRLSAASRYKGRGSDGTDLGCHVDDLVRRLTGSSTVDPRTGQAYTTNPVVLRPAGVNSGG